MSIFSEIFFSIWGVVSSLMPFVVLLGILVFIHELGHFLVARLCGVRVEVFSLGFGKKILKWKKGDTVYCISLFPLGGYVKMFGHEYDKKVAEKDQSVSFLHKTVWQRMAIVAAGPMMNFFLAIFIFAILSMASGSKKIHPVIGELDVSSPVTQSGLSYGDHILSINKEAVKSRKEVKQIIFKNPNSVLDIEVKKQSGEIRTYKISTTEAQVEGKWGFLETGGVIEGLVFFAPAPVIGVVDPASPAGQAGLQTFDEVLSVNGKKINSRKELFHLLTHPPSENFSWKMEIQRNQEIKHLVLEKPINYTSQSGIEALGLARSDLFIADLKKTGAAGKAGLKKKDFVFKINGEKVASWDVLARKIKSFDETKGPLELDIKRDGQIKHFSLIPELKTQMVEGGVEKKYYMLGIVSHPYHKPAGGIYIESVSNPFKAMLVGFQKTLHWSFVIAVYLKKFITGSVSRRTLGGPIAIGRVAYDSYSHGLESFFRLMAILSVNLFFLNILPIPVFDGGHLLFYIIEVFNRAPVSMRKMIVFQKMGLLFLLFLFIFTTFNDLHNWLFLW